MPIDPFAVLNALLRAEARRSGEHETKAPTTTSPAPTPAPAGRARTPGTRRDGHDTH
ncbi:hypothetical protein [Streptomyces niveus]|uniref:hypothetical protein n=1 Tax=Streptomyces niveus TaxID=193462 RepID=UPI002E356C0E|nr:hypothetical protein [Streptomyces niveus]